jgi:ssDNA-binding Zn-finger/Zn-ribbon topoisomerase 1
VFVVLVVSFYLLLFWEQIMTQSQQTVPSRRCPRCGGLMAKPSGSNLYWHADNNHPRCEITNIADASFAVETNVEPQSNTSKGNDSQK